MRAFKRTVEPGAEAVDLDRLRTALRIDESHDLDTELTARIGEATQILEHEYGIALITQTWQLQLDAFPSSGPIVVPRPPLQSVSSIQYIDESGVLQTWSSSLYRVDAFSAPGRITPAYEQTYPNTRPVTGAVTVTFVAGYGAAAADVPKMIQTALLLAAADLYRNPETIVKGSLSELPAAISVRHLMRLVVGYKAG